MNKIEIYKYILNSADLVDEYLEGSSLANELMEIAERFKAIKKK